VAPKIKLQRVGAKNQPKYRVVIQETREKLNGRVVEILGIYNPLEEPSIFQVDKEKTLDWIKKGALPTEKVRILLGKAGILPPVDLAALPKRKKKGEQPAEEAKPEEKKEEPKKEEPKKEEPKKEEPKKEEPKKEEPKKEEPKKEEPKAEAPKQEEKPKEEPPKEEPAKEEQK